MKRRNTESIAVAKVAILVLAEIRSATEAFERGDTNVFVALDTVVAAVEAYRSAKKYRPKAA